MSCKVTRRKFMAGTAAGAALATFKFPTPAIAQAAPADAFHGLFLTADLTTRLSRVGGRKGDASDADAAVAREQEHYDLGVLQWTPVDASGSPEQMLQCAKAALGLA